MVVVVEYPETDGEDCTDDGEGHDDTDEGHWDGESIDHGCTALEVADVDVARFRNHYVSATCGAPTLKSGVGT